MIKKQLKHQKNKIIYIIIALVIIVPIIGYGIYKYLNQGPLDYDYITVKYYATENTQDPARSLFDSVGVSQKYLIIDNYEFYQQCQTAFQQSGYSFMDDYTVSSDYFLNNNLVIVDNYIPNIDAYIPNIEKIKRKGKVLKVNQKIKFNDRYGECNLGSITYIQLDKKGIDNVDLVVEYDKTEADLEFDEKPILYLYPEEKTNITIKFLKEELLQTSYPKYQSSWDVTAYPDGTLYDSKGKYYYALYWDEISTAQIDFNTGFYVTKENAISFLEEKLAWIGLNEREKNEFIMYWLPVLEKNKKSLIYFELTKEREENSPLQITPKPDSILRIAMHIKKVNKKVTIKEQTLPHFERKGFTAIEWGGVRH